MADEPPNHRVQDGNDTGPGALSWIVAAALVHAFTASGIICAFFATIAVLDQSYPRMFAWLGLALVIDGIDGTFARMVDVNRRLPRFSGERLDQVVDYVTYVFVPALGLFRSGILSETWGLTLSILILMSSLYHFADNGNKTDDHCFVGFPAIWNIVAFYLFAFPMPGWGEIVVVLVCVALTFVPMRWLHPMRVERRLALNIAASVLWLAAAGATLANGFPAPFWAALILLAVGIYVVALTVVWPWAPAFGSDRT